MAVRAAPRAFEELRWGKRHSGVRVNLAAADIGLLTVLLRKPGGGRPRADGTPTVVHFCAVLLVSAILSAPWQGFWNVSFAAGACGAVGVWYALVVVRRAHRQTGYRPVLEDWLWHAVFPLIAYSVLMVAAVMLPHDPAAGLFAIGGAALLLLFIGIHNAWDSVTYIAIERIQPPKEPGDSR